jgi:hypothetical protein
MHETLYAPHNAAFEASKFQIQIIFFGSLPLASV